MKMNKTLCLLMAIMMLLTVCFPVAVFADDEAELVDEEVAIEVADEAIPDEIIADEDTYVEEDVLEEPVEDSQLETEVLDEAPEAEEAEEENTIDTAVEAVGEDNEFDAAYIKITEQPKDASGAVGAKVTFTVTAKNVVSYQWQVSTNNGASWINAGTKYYNGVTTKTITVPVKAARDGYQFRCVLTSATGKTVNTQAATLTVGAGLAITEQPKDASGAAGTKVTFHVGATGATTYKWQVSTNNGASWIDASAKYYTGVTTDTITVPVKAARDGYLFRCVVSDSSNSLNSTGGKLTVQVGPSITEQPKDATGAVGTKVTFHVTAKNAGSYKWQVSANNGTSWIDASAKYYTGVTTDTITVPVKEARDGYLFHCVITGSNTNLVVTSDSAKLTVEKTITVNGVIYEKLTDTTCAVVGYTGTNSSYTVEKTVNGMTVTEIGEEAFMGNTNLQSITLPDTITVIHARAFKGCTSLSKMG